MTRARELRAAKRGLMQANYRNNGLNGPRAVARRLRQIVARKARNIWGVSKVYDWRTGEYVRVSTL